MEITFLRQNRGAAPGRTPRLIVYAAERQRVPQVGARGPVESIIWRKMEKAAKWDKKIIEKLCRLNIEYLYILDV